MTIRNIFKLQGLTPHNTLTGEQSCISNLCQCGWIEWVYYLDDKKNFSEHKERLGKALGPSKGIGNEMCQWVLQPSSQVIARRAVSPLTLAENNSKIEEDKHKIFLQILHKKIGTAHNHT